MENKIISSYSASGLASFKLLVAVSRPEEEYFTSKSKKERERGGRRGSFDFFNFAVHKILHVSTVTIVYEHW
jgi:hypothetical protein